MEQTMKYDVVIGDQTYKVESTEESPEKVALLIKAMEIYYDYEIKYKAVKEEYESARYKMEQMFSKGNEEFGLKNINGNYLGITFVLGTEGTTKTERVFNQAKAEAILQELGIDEDEYYTTETKITGKRKDSIRVKAE